MRGPSGFSRQCIQGRLNVLKIEPRLAVRKLHRLESSGSDGMHQGKVRCSESRAAFGDEKASSSRMLL